MPAVLSFDPGSHGVSGRAALHSVTSELSFRDPSLLLALHINWEHQDMIQGLQLVDFKNPDLQTRKLQKILFGFRVSP